MPHSVLFARHLRIQGKDDVPRSPTNAERLQAFRSIAHPVIGNGWSWKFCRPQRQSIRRKQ